MRRKNTKFIASRCLLSNSKCITRKLSYRKDYRAMRPTYGCSENFQVNWYATRQRNFKWAFVLIDPMNEVRSFTRSWDYRGTQKNLGSPWICPSSLF